MCGMTEAHYKMHLINLNKYKINRIVHKFYTKRYSIYPIRYI